MSQYIVGSSITLTVTVTDRATNVAVDPATFAFRLRAPTTADIVAGTYTWNGTIWTSSEAVIAVPAKGATGIFTLTIKIPYVNTAKGSWNVGWKATANGLGLGEGANYAPFIALASPALEA